MIDINYIDYSQDLFLEVIKNSPAKIYVFDNYNNRLQAEEIYKQPVLEQRSHFLTMAELKEKLFPTDRLVLKEEKLSVILYELLTESEKEALAVNDYFDVIDLAGDFFHFYRELNEYNIKNVKGLKKWQEEKYRIFQNLRQRYIDYMKNAGYSDNTLNCKMENFTPHFLCDYREIVLVNIVNFTPFEKQTLAGITERGKNIRLYLQLSSHDFDEKEFKLRSVTIPERKKPDLKIYHGSEELLQITAMLNRFNGNQDSVLDANFNNSNYRHFLSSTEIEINKELNFTETIIYKFLECHYELLLNAENSGGRLKLCIEDLIKFCSREEFKNYYKIDAQESERLFQLAADDYVYFDKSLAEPGLEKITLLLKEVDKINKLKDLHEFCTYLENIEIKKLNDPGYKNNYIQYFDGLAELRSLADMNLISSWNSYFNNRSLGLFRLIINYLRYKKVEKIKDKGEKTIIEDLKCAGHIKRDRLFIINANDNTLPSLPARSFLLSESQREELGLPSNRKKRLQQKYNFFRHIFNSEKVIIFYLENLEEDKAASPFIEELKMDYNLESLPLTIKEENYPEVIKSIFDFEQKSDNYFPSKNREDDILKLESSDFPDRGYPLSFYKYKELKNCYYRFYLEYIRDLEERWIKFENKLNAKVLGIIVHEMFEEIMVELGRETDDYSLKLETGLIKEVAFKKMDKYELKIPAYYMSFYQKIIIPHIIQSIKIFFKKVKIKAGNEIEGLLTEWSPQVYRDFFTHDKSNFYLSGRIDLIIDVGGTRYIIDFKTGSGDSAQLDFYWLLLKPSIQENFRIEKYFYSVMDQRLDRSFTDPLKLEEKLNEELKKFINSDQYSAIYKSRCKKCNYRDICRVVIR